MHVVIEERRNTTAYAVTGRACASRALGQRIDVLICIQGLSLAMRRPRHSS